MLQGGWPYGVGSPRLQGPAPALAVSPDAGSTAGAPRCYGAHSLTNDPIEPMDLANMR